MRSPRDFSIRPQFEREFLLEDTWCNACSKADLGLDNPVEYAEDGRIYVQGSCRTCGGEVRSEIIDTSAPPGR